MFKREEYCTFDICKLLYENNYREGSNCCITQYTEDYIYDNEPEHPESHKKGEICIHNFYYKNGDDTFANLFELPTIYEVQKWFRDKHHINIYPVFDDKIDKWLFKVVLFGNNVASSSYYPSYERNCNNAEEAIRKGILYALELLNY